MEKYETLNVYTDGGSRGNPGPGAIAIVICDESGEVVKEHCECIGRTTNNQAEYSAVIKALELSSRLCKELKLFSDSKLVVNQLSGDWKVRDEDLKPFFARVQELEMSFKKVSYIHIRREKNKRADELVNEALDSK